MAWYRRIRAAGWSTVVLSSVGGLLVAALVVLTPWGVHDLPGLRDRQAPPASSQVVDHREDARSFLVTGPVSGLLRWFALASHR